MAGLIDLIHSFSEKYRKSDLMRRNAAIRERIEQDRLIEIAN